MRFEGKCVVITGAGSGIGRQTAIEFALEGAAVVAADLDHETALRTVGTISQNGGQAYAVEVDTSDPNSVKECFKESASIIGTLDILINSAGIREIKPVLELSYKDWCRVLDVNITGVFLCSQAFLQYLTENSKKGCIVNLASTCGVTGVPNRPAYTASKHAVVGLTKEMALEFGEIGIRVNAVGPGVTRTALTERYFQESEMAERVRSIHAMNRWGQADEIAKAIMFLASDDASFITGETLLVDGGWMAGKKM